MKTRVLQWATGRVGTECLRAVLEHPHLELVGVGSYDPAKVGKDAGEVTGLGRIGVPIVSVKDIAGLQADCVLHAPRGELERDQAVDEICTLLKSGKNVCTTSLMALVHPNTMEPEHRRMLEDACAQGGVSFHATGINSGFFAEVVAAFLSGVCQKVTHFHSLEVYDYETHKSYRTVVEFCRYGRPLAEAPPMPKNLNIRSGPPSMHLLADLMGVKIERITGTREFYGAEEPFDIKTTHIAKGTVAGRREVYTAIVNGKEAITMEYVHRANPRVATHWAPPAKQGVHRFENRITGSPNLISSIELGVEDVEHRSGPASVAARAVNAVQSLVAAKPGIRTMVDLPMLTAPFLPA